MPKQPPFESGFIESGRTYTIEGLCKAIGVEIRTIREARACGLTAHLIGGRKVVINGDEFNEWVKKSAPLAPVPKAKSTDPEE